MIFYRLRRYWKTSQENKGIAASLSCRRLCKEEQDGWLYTWIRGVNKPQKAITCTNKEAADIHMLSASHKQIADSREEANVHACYLWLQILPIIKDISFYYKSIWHYSDACARIHVRGKLKRT